MKKRLLLLEPYADETMKHVQEIRMLFINNGWEVQKLTPDCKTYHENSVLIIPDTGGLNGNASYCFNADSWMPPHVKPQDQGVEYFRLNRLLYYVQKHIPVIGLGYSAYVIFAEVLKGTLQFGPDGMSVGTSKIKAHLETELFFCPQKHYVCGGMFAEKNQNYGEELIIFAEQMLKYGGQGGNVKVPVPNPPSDTSTKLII